MTITIRATEEQTSENLLRMQFYQIYESFSVKKKHLKENGDKLEVGMKDTQINFKHLKLLHNC